MSMPLIMGEDGELIIELVDSAGDALTATLANSDFKVRKPGGADYVDFTGTAAPVKSTAYPRHWFIFPDGDLDIADAGPHRFVCTHATAAPPSFEDTRVLIEYETPEILADLNSIGGDEDLAASFKAFFKTFVDTPSVLTGSTGSQVIVLGDYSHLTGDHYSIRFNGPSHPFASTKIATAVVSGANTLLNLSPSLPFTPVVGTKFAVAGGMNN